MCINRRNYRVVNNVREPELLSIAIWQLRMLRIVRNVHNDKHSARHPEASQNAYHYERCVQSELSDMCYQLKTMSLVTLSLLTTLYQKLMNKDILHQFSDVSTKVERKYQNRAKTISQSPSFRYDPVTLYSLIHLDRKGFAYMSSWIALVWPSGMKTTFLTKHTRMFGLKSEKILNVLKWN